MFRLFGGKHPEFTIEIDRADAVYYPGDAVRATVTLASEREARFDEITVGLLCEERFRTRDLDVTANDDDPNLWHTEARWAGRETIAREGTLPAKYRQTYELAWQIPPQVTASYNGELAQVRWMVRAEMQRGAASKPVVRDAPLGVVVAPPNHFVSPGEFVETNPASRTLDVKFALPKLEFVQNEEVAGRALLQARERFTSDVLRLELVRTEFVSVAGVAGGITRRVVEAAQELSQNVALEAGASAAFDFRLPVPPKWCPSYRTANGYAIWQLELALPRPAQGVAQVPPTPEDEPRATQSLLVFNGYRADRRAADAEHAAAPANRDFAQDFAGDRGFAPTSPLASAELLAPPADAASPQPRSAIESGRIAFAPEIEALPVSEHARKAASDALGPLADDFPIRTPPPPLPSDPRASWRDSDYPPVPAEEIPPPVAPPPPRAARDTGETASGAPGANPAANPDASAATPAPKRRFCTHCGTPMPYEANFCPACGTPVHRGEGFY